MIFYIKAQKMSLNRRLPALLDIISSASLGKHKASSIVQEHKSQGTEQIQMQKITRLTCAE